MVRGQDDGRMEESEVGGKRERDVREAVGRGLTSSSVVELESLGFQATNMPRPEAQISSSINLSLSHALSPSVFSNPPLNT